jgi:iron complex outermembrane receptor protein
VLPSASGRIGRNFYSGDPSYENLSREQIAVGYEFQHRLNDAVVFRQNAKFVHVDLSARGLTVNYLDPIGATSSTVNRWASNTSETVSDINVDNQLEASFQTGALQHTTLAGVSVQAGTSDWTWRLGNASSIDTLNPVYNFNIAATTLALRSDQTVRSKQLGAYVQDQIKWGGLSLLLGGRHDWGWIDTDDRLRAAQVNQYDGAFSGRAGLGYEFSTGLAPYVSYATSFEPIIGTAADGTPYKPSEGKQTEVGIKYKPTGIDAFLTVAAFDITQTNVRTMSPVGTGYVQTGEIKSRGFEFEAHANPTSNLDLIASYAFVDATVSSDTDVSIIGNAPVSVPKHMASLWANYRFSERPVRGLSVSGGARYVGVSQGDPANSFAVPAVTLFDAALRYDFGTGNVQLKGVEGSVNVRNLFDKDYVSSCFSTGGCFYGQGRTVAAMLKYRW